MSQEKQSHEARQKLTKAIVQLIYYHPFYAHIVHSLPLVEAEWLQPKTMATDMRRIYYHPDFVNNHSLEEIVGVLCHEALHVAYFHPMRRGVRHHTLWNYACDYAVNQIIVDGDKLVLPANKLLDKRFRNMSVDQIYEILNKEAIHITLSFPGGGEDGDDGEPMWGGVLDPQELDGEEREDGTSNERPNGKPLSDSERSILENEVRMKVQQAATIAKSRGNLPGGVEGLIEALDKPKINWKEYIQRWVRGHTPDDYTWAKPNIMMLANHRVYMPRMETHGSGIGVLSVDTSGSVSDHELQLDVAEIAGVIEICNPEKLYIIQHDAIVQRVDIWEVGQDFKSLHIKGRGGTCIRPTFKKISELDDEIDWMIIFSDMEIGDWPKASEWPSYPVLLCSTGRKDTSPPGTGATYIPLRDGY